MAYLAPSDGGDSFAQTGAEFTLDMSDDDDLRSEISRGGEAYEMRSHPGYGEATTSTTMWDGDGDGDDDDDSALDDDEDDDFDRSNMRNRRFSATSTVASFQLYTPDEEAVVRRKFDRRLVLFVALLYMLSFLDRSSTFGTPLPRELSGVGASQ